VLFRGEILPLVRDPHRICDSARVHQQVSFLSRTLLDGKVQPSKGLLRRVHEPCLLPNLVILMVPHSCLLLLMIVDYNCLEIVSAGKEQLQVIDDVELQKGGRGLMRPEHVVATHEGLVGQ
jgi:hypothetical protein